MSLALLFIPAVPAFSVTAGVITQGFTCTCGCNMVVSACEGSMECTLAKKITDQVSEMLDEGKSKEEIVRYFVNTNGERILAAPTKEGFNLTAWVLPFFAMAFGGGLIYVFLERSLTSRKRLVETYRQSGDSSPIDKKYIDQFEKELSDF